MVRLEMYEGMYPGTGIAKENTRVFIEAHKEHGVWAWLKIIDQDTRITYKWQLTETDLENLVSETTRALKEYRKLKKQ